MERVRSMVTQAVFPELGAVEIGRGKRAQSANLSRMIKFDIITDENSLNILLSPQNRARDSGQSSFANVSLF